MKWCVIAIYEDQASHYTDWGDAADRMVDDDGGLPTGLVAMMEVGPDGIGLYRNAEDCEEWAHDEAYAREREMQRPTLNAMCPGLYRY